jgi:hypothetical protein
MTEWLTFGWEEMLWKFSVERFFSERQSPEPRKSAAMHKREFFSMGRIDH